MIPHECRSPSHSGMWAVFCLKKVVRQGLFEGVRKCEVRDGMKVNMQNIFEMD